VHSDSLADTGCGVPGETELREETLVGRASNAGAGVGPAAAGAGAFASGELDEAVVDFEVGAVGGDSDGAAHAVAGVASESGGGAAAVVFAPRDGGGRAGGHGS